MTFSRTALFLVHDELGDDSKGTRDSEHGNPSEKAKSNTNRVGGAGVKKLLSARANLYQRQSTLTRVNHDLKAHP